MFGVPGNFTYTYDNFGNRVTEAHTLAGSAHTLYDAAGHTKSVLPPDNTSVSYAYDGFDRMVRRRTSGGETTLFFHDQGNQEVTLETDGAGTVKTRYVLSSVGQPLANEVVGNGTGRGYYVTDPRGNLTQLLDQTKAVKATYAYDPYGKPKAPAAPPVGNWDSRLRFQLAPRDPKTGAYNLGARLYDPAVNRFVGADEYVGAAANLDLQLDPLTGNRYLYAGANPANMIDDGHAWIFVGWRLAAVAYQLRWYALHRDGRTYYYGRWEVARRYYAPVYR